MTVSRKRLRPKSSTSYLDRLQAANPSAPPRD
jgi:hypothetical protein